MKVDLLSLGTMYIDINAVDFPVGDGLEPEKEKVGGKYELTTGGSALNFARVAQNLGLSVAFIGKCGDDDAGNLLEEKVRKLGIEPHFIRSPKVQTNIGQNYVDSEGKQLQATLGTANASLNVSEILQKMDEVDEFEYLYLGGCFKLKALIPEYSKLIEKAKAKNAKIVLDHNRVNSAVTEEEIEIIKRLIVSVDMYLPSADELITVWDAQNIDEAVRKIQSASKCLIIVKDAEKGSIGFQNDQRIQVPAFKVEPKYTVGAGDAFNAGFIKAQIDGLSLEESLRFANATAAIKISKTGDLSSQDVKDLIS